MLYYRHIDSPLGTILLTATERSLTGLFLSGQKHFPPIAPEWCAVTDLPLFIQTQIQLGEYFQRHRHTFDLPLDPPGTAFQRLVWQQLRQIPLGQTRSYGEIARKIGQPNAARAVGAANGRNPISIVIPCHRVIASSGKLTGYAGGLDRKQWLLDRERC
jgi:methylated-DNA-[protein]-cysteine S-methyltransferase